MRLPYAFSGLLVSAFQKVMNGRRGRVIAVKRIDGSWRVDLLYSLTSSRNRKEAYLEEPSFWQKCQDDGNGETKT